MNTKILAWITMILIVAFIAIYFFVPKHVDENGNLKVGKVSNDEE